MSKSVPACPCQGNLSEVPVTGCPRQAQSESTVEQYYQDSGVNPCQISNRFECRKDNPVKVKPLNWASISCCTCGKSGEIST